LRNDREVVLAAVQQDGWSLLLAGRECQMDLECVRAAENNIDKNGTAGRENYTVYGFKAVREGNGTLMKLQKETLDITVLERNYDKENSHIVCTCVDQRIGIFI
jgi:hypothetical protein